MKERRKNDRLNWQRGNRNSEIQIFLSVWIDGKMSWDKESEWRMTAGPPGSDIMRFKG